MLALVNTALSYYRRGWVPVKVANRGKRPIGGDDWQNLRPTEEEVASWGECNVGCLLGSASGGLTDIDLDCAEAVELGPYYLPSTWVFGRPGKPRSHWLYICKGSRTKQIRGMNDKMALEIRGDNGFGDPGCQSVFPPSIHESGEQISWDPDYCDNTEGPLEIPYTKLISHVANLARGVLFMQSGATIDEAQRLVSDYVPMATPQKMATRTMVTLRTTTDVLDRAKKYIDKMDPAISGQGGHVRLFKAAIAMVRGFCLDSETAFSILETEYNPRCQPSWSDKELRHKVRQAERSTIEYGYLLKEGRR